MNLDRLMQSKDTLKCCRNEAIMNQALAMHDGCLRSVLHQHHGYEVSFGTDACAPLCMQHMLVVQRVMGRDQVMV